MNRVTMRDSELRSLVGRSASSSRRAGYGLPVRYTERTTASTRHGRRRGGHGPKPTIRRVVLEGGVES
jgi:hypothetical protein